MAYKFGDAVLDLAEQLTDVMESAATADGAAGKTTLVDNSLPITAPADDYYNQGTIFFVACTNTALDGTTAIITDFATLAGVSTYTFAAAAAQTKSGDRYAVIKNDWPRYILRQSINVGLRRTGDVDQQDASLTTVANQAEYNLPAGVFNVRTLEIAEQDSTPYDYYEVDPGYWDEIEGQIQFKPGYQPQTTGYKIRLTYNSPLADITSDSTALPTLLHPEYVIWEAMIHALTWRLRLLGNGEDNDILRSDTNRALNEAKEKAKQYRRLMRRKPRSHETSGYAIRTYRNNGIR